MITATEADTQTDEKTGQTGEQKTGDADEDNGQHGCTFGGFK